APSGALWPGRRRLKGGGDGVGQGVEPMKAVVCQRWGNPEEVLEVRDVPEPIPGPGQVLVRMIASPVNPSDLLMVRGEYGRQARLPATPGFEGVGVVERGHGLLAWRVRGR